MDRDRLREDMRERERERKKLGNWRLEVELKSGREGVRYIYGGGGDVAGK